MILRTSVGVEIAGKDLRVAVVRSTFGKLQLLRNLEVPGFLELSEDDRKAGIDKLLKESKLPITSVFLSVPREQGVVRQLDLPVEVREKLKPTIALQLETLCPWPVDEIYWDVSQAPIQKGAKTLRVTVAIIPRAVLDPWIEFFKSVNMPLTGACLSSLACGHGVGVLWPGKTPTIVLNCEADYVEACLVQGSQISSVTQSGGEMTEISRSAVERLMAVGRVSSAENVRYLFYGGSMDALEEPERVALPMEQAARNSSDKFGAIATALLGVKRSPFESNLVPIESRYRRSRMQLVPTYALIGIAALLGLVALVREPYQLMVYASQIDAEIQSIAPVAREVATQQDDLNKLSEKYRALSSYFEGRDLNLEAMRELARILPPTTWLTSYTFQDRAVTMVGFADSASEVQKILEDNAIFKEVQFTSAVTKDAKGKDRFALKAVIEGAQ